MRRGPPPKKRTSSRNGPPKRKPSTKFGKFGKPPARYSKPGKPPAKSGKPSAKYNKRPATFTKPPTRSAKRPATHDTRPARSGRPPAKSPRLPARSAKPPTARRSPTPRLDETTPDDWRPLALEAVEAALDKKAERPTLLEVRQLSSYADYVLVLSGDSERQLDAISRSIEERLRAKGKRVRGIEAGAGESSWILMDFGDLIVHIFLREARDFYDLEGLWHDAPRVPVPNDSTTANR